MFGLLALLFILIPALEIYLLIEVGSLIGGFNTMLIVIITGIVGAALAKAQGLAVLYKIQNDLNLGQIPADQIIHGLLVFGGGLLLLTPGFVTDIIGLCMVAPGSRHLIVARAKHYFQNGIKNGNIRFTTFGRTNSGGFYYSNTETQAHHVQDDNVIEVDFEEKK